MTEHEPATEVLDGALVESELADAIAANNAAAEQSRAETRDNLAAVAITGRKLGADGMLETSFDARMAAEFGDDGKRSSSGGRLT